MDFFHAFLIPRIASLNTTIFTINYYSNGDILLCQAIHNQQFSLKILKLFNITSVTQTYKCQTI